MSWVNYHNHCHYCDGKGSVEEHVLAAISKGVFSLGFSSHCPVPFDNNWSMSMDQMQSYLSEIDEARKKYMDRIEVYSGLEVDFIPQVIGPADKTIRDLKLDYTIGSVHFVGAFASGRPWEIDGSHQIFARGLSDIYEGDVQYVIQKYFELTRQMVRESCPDIVGHIDKIKMQNLGLWDEEAAWYRKEVLLTLEEIRGAGAIIEVNTRGLYKKLIKETYPSPWILKQILNLGIPIHINSDAHTPEEITNEFAASYELVFSLGFRNLKILVNGIWESGNLGIC